MGNNGTPLFMSFFFRGDTVYCQATGFRRNLFLLSRAGAPVFSNSPHGLFHNYHLHTVNRQAARKVSNSPENSGIDTNTPAAGQTLESTPGKKSSNETPISISLYPGPVGRSHVNLTFCCQLQVKCDIVIRSVAGDLAQPRDRGDTLRPAVRPAAIQRFKYSKQYTK